MSQMFITQVTRGMKTRSIELSSHVHYEENIFVSTHYSLSSADLGLEFIFL